MRGLLPVAGHWVSVLTGLVPLALVIALSPLSVIPAVLVVHSPQPRPSSLAFLGGWLLGLAVVTAVFVAASGALGGLSTTSPAWASWLRVVLGSALIVFGVLRWLTRHRHTEMPGWMRAFASFTPARAGLVGAGGGETRGADHLRGGRPSAAAATAPRVPGFTRHSLPCWLHPRSRSRYWPTWLPVTDSTIRWNDLKTGWRRTMPGWSRPFWS